MKVETQTLWDEFAKTGDVEIRNRLVEKYLYIVKYVADRLGQKLPRSIPNEDLRSAASFGLTAALQNSLNPIGANSAKLGWLNTNCSPKSMSSDTKKEAKRISRRW